MASGRLNKPVQGSLSLYADWTSQALPSENASNIAVKLYLRHSRLNMGSKNASITIDGNTTAIKTPSINQGSSGNFVTLLGQSSRKVSHDNSGHKSVNIAFSVTFDITYDGVKIGTKSASGVFALDYIDRTAPTIDIKLINADTNDITVEGRCRHSGQGVKKVSFAINGVHKSSVNTSGTDVTHRYTFSGLTPNTQYTIAVTAESGAGVQGKKEQTAKTTFNPIATITLDKEKYTLDEGQSVQTQITIFPSDATNKKLQWSTSNNAAKVSENGLITALTKGTTTITATAADGYGAKATATVDVIRRVQGVVSTVQQIELPKGAVATADVIVTPSDATDTSVAFSSSAPTIATVDSSGVIEAVDIGTATITATTTDGNYTADILVVVSGEAKWVEYSDVPPFINWWDINNVYSNCLYLRSKLIEKGYTDIPILAPLNTNGTEEYLTMGDVLNATIENIQKINVFNVVPILPLGDTEPDYTDWLSFITVMNKTKIYAESAGMYITIDNKPLTIDNKQLITVFQGGQQ